MRKILSFIFAILIIFSMCSISINAEEQQNVNEKTYKDFSYIVGKNGCVTITKYSGRSSYVIVPSKIEDKTVVTIGNSAFMFGEFGKNETLKKVVIPDSVKQIESYAFYRCVSLKEVTFGKNIQTIGTEAFYYCKNLASATLGNKVKKIGELAFAGCKKISSFKIPSKLTQYHYVLANTGVKSLNFGKSVKKISIHYIGNANKNLRKIIVSKNNKKYSSKKGILYNKKKTKLLYCPPGLNKTSIRIPKSVKIISSNAFEYNKRLITIGLPTKLKTVEDGAFAGCKKLKKIILPKKVSEIYEYAFAGCKKLKSINIKNKKATIYDNAFSGSGIKMFKVTQGVYEGCLGCKQLKKLNISSDLKYIGTRQFFNCPKLKAVTIPSTVKEIGTKAFGFKYNSADSYKETKVKDFTIRGKSGSAAEKYAKKNKFKFVALD